MPELLQCQVTLKRRRRTTQTRCTMKAEAEAIAACSEGAASATKLSAAASFQNQSHRSILQKSKIKSGNDDEERSINRSRIVLLRIRHIKLRSQKREKGAKEEKNEPRLQLSCGAWRRQLRRRCDGNDLAGPKSD